MERTLDDSANRRLVMPQAFLAVDAILILYRNVVRGLVVYPQVIAKHLRDELPFMATENILMAAVAAGGDRQDLHERIRRHSQAAAATVKQQGGDNDLLARLAGDPAFAAVDFGQTLDPGRFVGRAGRWTSSSRRSSCRFASVTARSWKPRAKTCGCELRGSGSPQGMIPTPRREAVSQTRAWISWTSSRRSADSDLVLLAPRPLALRLPTGVAEARNDQPMARNVEFVLLGDMMAELQQLHALKLDQFLAALAVQMIVLGIAVIVFIHRTPRQLELTQQPRVDKFVQRAVYRGTADVARFSLARQLVDQRVGIEVVVLAEHVIDQQAALLGVPHPATVQVFLEPLAQD